jgi:hypothetical protein
VFIATQAAGGADPSVVYVVDGNGPTAIAEHFPSGIAALAADAGALYVANYSAVTAFSRTSGNQTRQWPLPPITPAANGVEDAVSMVAAAGRVFVSITQGISVSVYEINPSSTAAPMLAAEGSSAVVGGDGTIYYEAPDHDLTALSVSGARKTGPALVDAPNSEGGGIQSVQAVAGGAVWVTEPAGQGEDTQWTTFDDDSLQQLAQFSGNVSEFVVDTPNGALMAASPGSQNPCTADSPGDIEWCLSRVSVSGQQTDSQTGFQTLDLLGPDPVLIATVPTSGVTPIQLWRIT